MTISKKNNLLHVLPITTSRLRLVNMDQKYAQAICDGFTPEVESFMFMTTTKSFEEMIEYINKTIRRNEIGKSFELVITDHDDNFGQLENKCWSKPHFTASNRCNTLKDKY